MSDVDPASDLQCFNRDRDYAVAWKRLPHWAQAGTVSFITWRTADSLPDDVADRLNRQRQELLRQHQLKQDGDWKSELAKLPPDVRGRLHGMLFAAWDDQLDSACGACLLRDPELSGIVMDSLLHFDSDRYVLTDAVVMPNHVHLLVAFRNEELLLTQCRSWKHFTATQINQRLRERSELHGLERSRVPLPGARGKFWQVEQFDHLVRSPADFEKYRRYIAENPVKARLPAGSYRYYSKAVEVPGSSDRSESQSRSD